MYSAATNRNPWIGVIKLINPMLRGWVAYFAVGISSECVGFIKDWVEKFWGTSDVPLMLSAQPFLTHKRH